MVSTISKFIYNIIVNTNRVQFSIIKLNISIFSHQLHKISHISRTDSQIFISFKNLIIVDHTIFINHIIIHSSRDRSRLCNFTATISINPCLHTANNSIQPVTFKILMILFKIFYTRLSCTNISLL